MDEHTDLHPAVQLILKRMESHPDEFTVSSSSPMRRLITKYETYFTPAERVAVQGAVSGLMKDAMHKEVLHQMLAPAESPVDDINSQRDAMARVITGPNITATAPTPETNVALRAYGLATMAEPYRSAMAAEATASKPAKRRSILSWGSPK
jgi:hypothetical protein